MLLSDMFITNKNTFNECFTEFDQTMFVSFRNPKSNADFLAKIAPNRQIGILKSPNFRNEASEQLLLQRIHNGHQS